MAGAERRFRGPIRKALCATLASVSILAGCSSDSARRITLPAPPDPGAYLRIQNAGNLDVESLTVYFPGGEVAYGTVPAGVTTDYAEFPQGVYRYAAYRFSFEGHEWLQPVIDWVGETPMDGDTFTYSVELVPSQSARPVIRVVEVRRDR